MRGQLPAPATGHHRHRQCRYDERTAAAVVLRRAPAAQRLVGGGGAADAGSAAGDPRRPWRVICDKSGRMSLSRRAHQCSFAVLSALLACVPAPEGDVVQGTTLPDPGAGPSSGAGDSTGTAPAGESPLDSGSPEQGRGPTSRISLNGLPPRVLSLAGGLQPSVALGQAAAGPLARSADGRELLAYAAPCALPSGAVLRAGDDEAAPEFAGLFGLAPEWQSGTCEQSCQRWVSACLMAHVNATDTHIPVVIRGPHPALLAAAGSAEEAPFTVREGAFYGNLFGGRQTQLACEDARAWTADWEWTYLHQRVCASSESCGFRFVEACDLWLSRACAGAAEGGGGYFVDCYSGGFAVDPSGGTGSGEQYGEVITTFLIDNFRRAR
jgi:hypothetical protein